jgi:hypothetical protein
MGQKLPFRHTFTRKSDSELRALFEVQANGVWLSMGEETCKK